MQVNSNDTNLEQMDEVVNASAQLQDEFGMATNENDSARTSSNNEAIELIVSNFNVDSGRNNAITHGGNEESVDDQARGFELDANVS